MVGICWPGPNHASCCKTRHMPRTVSRDPVARGHGNTVSLATVQITVRSRHRGRSREGRQRQLYHLESLEHETPPYCGRMVPASFWSGTNINSSTGHETPPYCGRPVPPPRLAFIILLKAVPVPLGPPTAQSPARQHIKGLSLIHI